MTLLVQWELLGVFKDKVVVGRVHVSLSRTFILKNSMTLVIDEQDSLGVIGGFQG